MKTPFGEVVILIDGKEMPYTVVEREKDNSFKDVLGCYIISVPFRPDGKEHEIRCVIPDIQYVESGPESGENIECQSFYNSRGEKLSICVECETGYLPDGRRWSDKYDYDAEYLENGMSYRVLEKTVECEYVFGIAWIDKIFDEAEEIDHDRDVQTWLAADFTYRNSQW